MNKTYEESQFEMKAKAVKVKQTIEAFATEISVSHIEVACACRELAATLEKMIKGD